MILNSTLLRGWAVGIWDANDFYLQYHTLTTDYARAGRFLHWDPWTNAGTAAAADPQTGAFSPVTFLVGLMTSRTSYGFIVYWLLMWWLGGFGMLMLARHLKAPAWGACAVALGFLYCGFYTGHAQHTSAIAAFSFLPLLIWRLDVALLSGKRLPAVEAGALLGLSALAGYPALIILNGCFCALWAAGRWLCAEETSSAESSGMEFQPDASDAARPVDQLVSWRTVFSSLALMLLVGIVILSPTYFAFLYEGVGIQQRAGGVSLDAALVNSLHPGALATFASPYMILLKS
ncbi:MAG: hypothetical protein H0U54_00955, partial [Acidobacteria bacterium]|nr:hypothetical protein [Acidobacteriota bacterium]